MTWAHVLRNEFRHIVFKLLEAIFLPQITAIPTPCSFATSFPLVISNGAFGVIGAKAKTPRSEKSAFTLSCCVIEASTDIRLTDSNADFSLRGNSREIQDLYSLRSK